MMTRQTRLAETLKAGNPVRETMPETSNMLLITSLKSEPTIEYDDLDFLDEIEVSWNGCERLSVSISSNWRRSADSHIRSRLMFPVTTDLTTPRFIGGYLTHPERLHLAHPLRH